ncbi:MAG: ribonuclease E inhibitor RraB [Gillisia sp.]
MKYLNRIVIGLFRAMGGSMKNKHPVTHWFYFQKKEDLLKFENYMNQIGFSTIDKRLARKTPMEHLLLIIGRDEKLNEDSINFDTKEFIKLAKEHHGEYDGWETLIE